MVARVLNYRLRRHMQIEETLKTSLFRAASPLPHCDCPWNIRINRADTMISQARPQFERDNLATNSSCSRRSLELISVPLKTVLSGQSSCLPGVAQLICLPTAHHYFFHLIWGQGGDWPHLACWDSHKSGLQEQNGWGSTWCKTVSRNGAATRSLRCFLLRVPG